MKAYRSIEQLYHLFKRMKAHADYHEIPYNELGTYHFRGTVKLHGTNGGIVLNPNAAPVAQSRTRTLSVTSDNHGFAFFTQALPAEELKKMYAELNPKGEGELTVFGEWCGGNIQGGVALSQTPKHFVIFGAHVDEEYVALNPSYHSNENGIYNIHQIPGYECEIDFSLEDQSELEQYLSQLTQEVENECPWAKQMFGVSGIGEGLVWECVERPLDTNFTFKTKGEKHSVRKNKTKNLVAADPERAANIQECVDIILTENRMQQMVDKFSLPFDYKAIGQFLQAVSQDCAKEEIDVVIASGLEWKEVAKVIQYRARQWFLDKIQKV